MNKHRLPYRDLALGASLLGGHEVFPKLPLHHSPGRTLIVVDLVGGVVGQAVDAVAIHVTI
jgi:hypothetical protein